MRTKQYVAVAILCVLAAQTAHAAELKDFAGTWATRLAGRTLFVLTLTPDGSGGSFEHPSKFTSNSFMFWSIRDGVRRDPIVHATFAGGVLHLVVRNVNDAKDEDRYAMSIAGDQARLAFDDRSPSAGRTPYVLSRTTAGERVAMDWEPNRAYVATDSDVPNPEMKSIFDEDQRVRMAPTIDWPTVNKTDAERREKTRKLLAAGDLHTAKDYEEAAFIYQHGDSPQDYLLAHTLAMVAVSKGDAGAIWIAAATLDRYLEDIGQKQIFGTQFSSDDKNVWTQEPYNRSLVSDSLRQQLGVPSQAGQAEQLKYYQLKK